MKLVKLVHKPDWIRFSKELEIKVNDMITAKAAVYGGMVTLQTSIGDFIALEDVQCEIDYYLNGEALKRDGFKELYTKLFKNTTFDKFEESIEDFCEAEVQKGCTRYIGHLDPAVRIKIIKELLSRKTIYTTLDGEKIVSNSWDINEVFLTFGREFVFSSKRFELADNEFKYGVPLYQINKTIERLQTKYDLYLII